jgi:aminoglycoside phosphotransferase family enzyme
VDQPICNRLSQIARNKAKRAGEERDFTAESSAILRILPQSRSGSAAHALRIERTSRWHIGCGFCNQEGYYRKMTNETTLPGIEEKVAFLSGCGIYPVPAHRVEIRETHMSWLFLTDAEVWKLKKPARTEYLDFSTIEARRRNCEEEVRLNRRLAPDVYLGAVPLTIGVDGRMRIGGEGEVIDWLVRMRRLPAARMLDRAIADGTAGAEDLRNVGRLLASFYSKSEPAAITPSDYRKRLAADVRGNHRELAKPEYDLPADLLGSITEAQLAFLERKPELFDDRVSAGKIVEAHGDLRPEHICLGSRPAIIDCLEFNRDFRTLDSASELAFLALECERLGAPEAGDRILQACREETGDNPPEELLVFYRSFHACLRAKIAVWHLRDDGSIDRAKWIDRAKHYLQMAAPMIV